MNQTVRVIVDDRERGAGVDTALAAMAGVELVEQRLPLGDYDVDGLLLVERKTVADFSLSIVDGRLFRQATRLAQAGTRACFIVEGSEAEPVEPKLSREAIQGALVSISIVFGLPVLRSATPAESAHLMIYAARQARRAMSSGLRKSGYSPRGLRRKRLRILQSLPGIGSERAGRLLDKFGSVEDVMCADAEELAEVEGIGEATARGIREILGPEPVAGAGLTSI